MTLNVEKIQNRKLIRLSTAGSVDDGKSTLIGRFLTDCNALPADHLKDIEKYKNEDGTINYAYLLDGLNAEKEQGITIDVAYRYFSTEKKQFILADSPGHEQYTRNMVTATSMANITLILIDAHRGIQNQSRRHAFITSLLKVPRVLILVNKMDLVDWSEERYNELKAEFSAYLGKLDIKSVDFIPVSALHGDNVVHPSKKCSWYQGPTIINFLDNLYTDSDDNTIDFRFAVQNVIRPDQNFRGFAGLITSGRIKVGDEVRALPSEQIAKIDTINLGEKELPSAEVHQSVVLTLDREIDISRGDQISRVKNIPMIDNQFEAQVVWMDADSLKENSNYLIKHTSKYVKATISTIQYKFDIDNLSQVQSSQLNMNDIGRVVFETHSPIVFDFYSKNKANGSFIIIDEINNRTVGAGILIQKVPGNYLKTKSNSEKTQKSKNIVKSSSHITKSNKEDLLNQSAKTFWFSGLSGSGKSTIAKELERNLFESKKLVALLDGDNMRFGLCRDLGFTNRDRSENIRRAAEVAKLMNDNGLVVVTAFISPFEKDRALAREIIGKDNFVEVFVNTPLEICEERDPKGLYKKARLGEITRFTGISSPFEEPENADIVITHEETLEQSIKRLTQLL